MVENEKNTKFKIKVADKEDLFDLKLCASEFIEFLDNFKKKFQNKKFFILTAYDKHTLIGILIAEDKSKEVDSIDKVIPKIRLNLLYVNPKFRNMNLGRRLMNTFIMIKKKEGFAGIIIRLPKNYRKGVNYFIHNTFLGYKFHLKTLNNSKIELEMNLWNNLGIREFISIDTITYEF